MSRALLRRRPAGLGGRRRARRRLSAGALNLPGFGASFGSAFFTASRTVIQPPLAPGTAPSTRIRPRSTSVCTTRRLSVVTRSTPIWPGIFLFLNVLPGSWRPPVEPIERCETDTPCVARRPPKFQRFMPPAKPLPIEVPVTSTNWPTTKWSAVISAPTGMSSSSLDAEFRKLALGLDLGDREVAALGLADVLDLAGAGAELQRDVAVLLLAAVRDRPGIAQAAAPSPARARRPR